MYSTGVSYTKHYGPTVRPGHILYRKWVASCPSSRSLSKAFVRQSPVKDTRGPLFYHLPEEILAHIAYFCNSEAESLRGETINRLRDLRLVHPRFAWLKYVQRTLFDTVALDPLSALRDPDRSEVASFVTQVVICPTLLPKYPPVRFDVSTTQNAAFLKNQCCTCRQAMGNSSAARAVADILQQMPYLKNIKCLPIHYQKFKGWECMPGGNHIYNFAAEATSLAHYRLERLFFSPLPQLADSLLVDIEEVREDHLRADIRDRIRDDLRLQYLEEGRDEEEDEAREVAVENALPEGSYDTAGQVYGFDPWPDFSCWLECDLTQVKQLNLHSNWTPPQELEEYNRWWRLEEVVVPPKELIESFFVLLRGCASTLQELNIDTNLITICPSPESGVTPPSLMPALRTLRLRDLSHMRPHEIASFIRHHTSSLQHLELRISRFDDCAQIFIHWRPVFTTIRDYDRRMTVQFEIVHWDSYLSLYRAGNHATTTTILRHDTSKPASAQDQRPNPRRSAEFHRAITMSQNYMSNAGDWEMPEGW